MMPHHEITWVDHGRRARNPADPKYPKGIDLDVSGDRAQSCRVELPYPAKGCGVWVIQCAFCGLRAGGITAAGRVGASKMRKAQRVPVSERRRQGLRKQIRQSVRWCRQLQMRFPRKQTLEVLKRLGAGNRTISAVAAAAPEIDRSVSAQQERFDEQLLEQARAAATYRPSSPSRRPRVASWPWRCEDAQREPVGRYNRRTAK